jgi:hypothetical protein
MAGKIHKNTKMAFAENHGKILFDRILLSPGLAVISETIFDQLDWKTLENCELVCKLWRKFVIDAEFWKRRFMHKFAKPGSYAHDLIEANPKLIQLDQADKGNKTFCVC